MFSTSLSAYPFNALQIRCCDSCFNYLSYETEKRRYNAFAKQQSKQGLNSQSQSPVAGAGVGSSSSSSASAAASASSSSSATQAKQAVAKKDLFGNAVIAVMGAGRDRSDTKTNASASAVSGTMSTMSEAHDRLVERGEKLAKLNDKSADVANAAEEFSKLAKQLNEQQKNRWF
jgi:Synaptobrevin